MTRCVWRTLASILECSARGRRTLAGVTLVLCLQASWSQAADTLPWDSLSEGFDVTVWAPGSACDEDVTAVMVRIDPELFGFSVYQFRDEGMPSPVPLLEWQQRTGALLLFNAGLFLDDFSYMGLLYKNGEALSRKRHTQWQALFVAEPVETGMRRAKVLDLSFDSFPEESVPYREAAQALMLLDRTGKVRVRQSGKKAQQTLVAEDARGYVYVIKTVTASTLYGLGTCLHRTLPWMWQAMAMDGGSSSDLVVGSELLIHAGKSVTGAPWRAVLEGTAPAAHIPLPTVIGVAPRTKPSVSPEAGAAPRAPGSH